MPRDTRLAGNSLKLVARVLWSRAGGVLRRRAARDVIVRILDDIDFEREGEPAPLYAPPTPPPTR